MSSNILDTSPVNNNVGGKRCLWCRKWQQKLDFVLTIQEGRKEFCTRECLLYFRNVYHDKKNPCTLCSNCDCVVRIPASESRVKLSHQGNVLEYCCVDCLEEYKTTHGIILSPKATPHSPAAKKKQENLFSNESFKWSEYLEKTKGVPAPSHYFTQTTTPPSNEFVKDMKLEAVDPRNTTSTCMATVIASIGPRIKLRLDGTDNCNDFWRMVDSPEIQPVGTSEDKQVLVQPPLGFSRSSSSWPKFLLKKLQGSTMAPKECFKPEPPKPRFNLFKIGHKLEAVDRKDPDLICVATVGGVDRDNVHITFDGWGSAFAYWCKFDSRDIFPVGWSASCGHPLQSPGNKLPLLPTITPMSIPQISSSSATVSADSAPSQDSSSTPVPPYLVTLHLQTYCDCGPYLEKAKLPSNPIIIGPLKIQDVYNQFVQILNKAAINIQQVEKLLPVQGSEILEQGDFWNEILGIIERFQFCENLLNDKAFQVEVGRTTRTTTKSKKCSKCGGGRNEEVGSRSVGAKRKIVEVVEQQVSQPEPTSSKRPLLTATSIAGDPGKWTIDQVIANIFSNDDDDDDDFNKDHAKLFRQQEIDGAAMLMLDSDTMIQLMGLNVASAMKICNRISQCKTKSNTKNGGSN